MGSEAEGLESYHPRRERPADDAKADLSEVLSLIMLERGRLARTMIPDKLVPNQEQKQATEDLYSLISQEYSGLYRPRERPIRF